MEKSFDMVDEERGKKFKILKELSLMSLVISSFLSSMAFSAYEMTEAWYIVNQLEKESFLGIVLILTTVPRLFFMLIGGALADRYNPIKIMMISNISRGILLIMMALLFHFNFLNIWILMIFALLYGILDAYFWPASSAILPSIVKKENLTRANSIMRAAVHLSMILGPIVCALILAKFGYTSTFIFISILVGLSLLLLKFINCSTFEREIDKNTLFSDVKEGFIYISKTKVILSFIIVFMVFNFLFMGPVGLGAPLIVQNVLKGDAMILAILDSGWAIGLLLGSILTGLINLNKKRGKTVMYLLLFIGLLTIIFGYIDFVWGSVIIISLMGISMSMVNIPIYSFVQEKTDEKMLGRVMSLLNISSNGLVPLSFATVSLGLSMGFLFSTILTISGILLVLFCLVILLFVKNVRNAD